MGDNSGNQIRLRSAFLSNMRLAMRIRVLLVASAIAFVVLGSQAARWLVVDQPQRADAIIVLAGEASIRPAHALELLRQGMASRVFLDAESREQIYDQRLTDVARRFIEAQPDKEQISICPITGLSTYAETDDVKQCLQPYGVHTVLIVTSASHTRRALSIFRRRLPQYQFSAAAAPDATHFGAAWWTNREWAKTTLGEWTKLLWWEAVDRWR